MHVSLPHALVVLQNTDLNCYSGFKFSQLELSKFFIFFMISGIF